MSAEKGEQHRTCMCGAAVWSLAPWMTVLWIVWDLGAYVKNVVPVYDSNHVSYVWE